MFSDKFRKKTYKKSYTVNLLVKLLLSIIYQISQTPVIRVSHINKTVHAYMSLTFS